MAQRRGRSSVRRMERAVERRAGSRRSRTQRVKCRVVGGRRAGCRRVGREGGRVRRVVWRVGTEVGVWRGRARKWVSC